MSGRYYGTGTGLQGRYPPATPSFYREFPNWITGVDGCPTIVQSIEEERRILWQRARDIGRKKANAVQRARADSFAAQLTPKIAALRARANSFRDIADALNRQGIPSARGRKWGPGQILRLLRRAENTVATCGPP